MRTVQVLVLLGLGACAGSAAQSTSDAGRDGDARVDAGRDAKAVDARSDRQAIDAGNDAQAVATCPDASAVGTGAACSSSEVASTCPGVVGNCGGPLVMEQCTCETFKDSHPSRSAWDCPGISCGTGTGSGSGTDAGPDSGG
jgi:hypothetical protein